MSNHLLDITILSAGAIEPALVKAAENFQNKNGCIVNIQWATTPAIKKIIAEGKRFDLLVIPPDALNDFKQSGLVDASSKAFLGQVGVGIAVRDNAPLPQIESVDALIKSLMMAEKVIYNRASSGIYMHELFQSMNILEAIQDKLIRFDNGPTMLERLIHGHHNEFGFCASVEILMYKDKGLKLAGLLPLEIQRFTQYWAVPFSQGFNRDGAISFLSYLSSQESKKIFLSFGIS